MKTLLLTGFGLWGKETYNTSWEILRDNPLALPDGWRVATDRLPVSWTGAPDALDAALADPTIRAVVCFGMCESRLIRIERIALNLDTPGLLDADGRPPPGEHVAPGAPPAFWTTLPLPALLTALAQANVPAAESRSAGGFLCNHTFYHLMHRLAARTPAAIGGFVHVPHYETEGGLPAGLLRLAVPVIAAETVRAADAPELPLFP